MHKWFVYGRDEDLDAALRFLEQRRFGEAAMHLDIFLDRPVDAGLRRLARQLLVSALVHMAADCVLQQNRLEALMLMRSAVKHEPDYPDLLVRLASLEAMSGGSELATQHLSHALTVNPNYALARALQDAIGAGDDPLDWDAFIEEHPSISDQRQQIEVAGTATPAEVVSQLIWAEPSRQQIEDTKARAANAEPEEAKELLLPLISRYPAFPDLRFAMGQACLAADKLDEAYGHFSKAVLLNPRYADAFASLGITLRRMGKSDEAKSCFQQALEIDPSHPVAAEEARRI